MAIGSILQIFPYDFKPSAPPAGQFILYVKGTTIYLQDSAGTEIAFGSTTGITDLVGEATGTGPGSTTVTLSNSAVIGKILTGFTPGPNSTVLATDTILQAIQKLQSQISSVAGASLAGDVTGTLGATVVSFVGGKSASDISTSVDDTQAATSSNTASTLVKRDASGNFSANTITANLSGNATTATSSTSFSGALVGDVTGTQGATVVSTVGTKTAAQVSTSVDDTLAATSINTASTIVKRDASGNFAANTITANLTGTASGNEPPITATTSADYYRGDKTFQPLNAAAIPDFSEATQDAVGSILIDTSTIDFTYDDAGNQITADVKAGSITNTELASGIDATKIGAGTVSNTEFGYLDGVTSPIQTQINTISGSGITSLTGDVTATGPGAAAATVVSVGGSSATNINTAELAANAATDVNTPSTIVKRDASGNFSAGTITASLTGNVNGVDPAAHASRHLPSGADALTTAAPTTNLDSTTTNSTGSANSLARSDHGHAISTGVASTIIPDQVNAAGSSANLAKADHIHNIPSGTPVQIGTSNFIGAASSFALSDHIHSHGNQSSGTLHAAATTLINGFMSSTDKTKLDTFSGSVGTNAQILISDGTSYSPHSVSGDASITNAGVLTVNSVGGSSAANINTAEIAANAATSLDTASTIMKRDASKNTHINALLEDSTNNVLFDIQNRRILDTNGKYQLDASQTLQTVSLINNSDAIAQLHKTVTGASAQFLIQNLATGGNESTDFIVNADTGVDANNYADFGINSSGYVDPSWTINGALGAYLYNNDGDLAVGTASAQPVLFFTGGTLAANEKARFNAGQGFQLKTSLRNNVITLVDGASIATDASLGNIFTVTIAGNRTFAAPTNPTADQKITYKIRQDVTGGRVITWDAAFNFGVDLSGVPNSTSPNVFDYYGFQYNAVTSKWDCLAISRGY